ncbi:5308_t:CDS:1, partial [Ambispora leptoticha]
VSPEYKSDLAVECNISGVFHKSPAKKAGGVLHGGTIKNALR